MTTRKQIYVVLLVIAFTGVFYLVTIRPGHRWNDDFSMYIHHAENIVQGKDYRDTGYLYDPITAVIGPRFYPPVFPFILAPVYAAFGMDLTMMKVVVILFFLMFLGVFAWAFKDDLPFPFLVGAVLVMGLNPFFWDFKDEIVSDLPFLFLVYLGLWLINAAHSRVGGGAMRIWRVGVLIGIVLYLAAGTRTAGIILVPTLLINELVRLKRVPFREFRSGFSRQAVIATVVFLGLYLIQRLSLGQDGYNDQVVFFPQVFLNNLHLYFDAFAGLWADGFSAAVQAGLVVMLIGLGIAGIFTRLKGSVSVYEIFGLLYLALITVWRANQGLRLLLPLVPLLLLYSFQGLTWLVRTEKLGLRRVRRLVLPAFLVVILISYAGVYSQTNFVSFEDGIDKQEAVELFDFIEKQTRPEDAFLFVHPRALALFTNRPAAGYSKLENEQFTLDYATKLGIQYFVVKSGEDYLRLLVKRYPERFESVYSNAEFKVYRYLVGS